MNEVLAYVGLFVAFSALAYRRSSESGDDLRRGAFFVALIGTAILGEAVLSFVHRDSRFMAIVAATAFLGVNAVTDAFVWKLYLPVTIVGGCIALLVHAGSGMIGECLSGAAALGACGAIFYAVGRGRSSGLGDVLQWIVVGAFLGPIVGVYVLALGLVIGGLFAACALALRAVSRRAALPVGPFVYAGLVGTIVGGTHGLLRGVSL